MTLKELLERQRWSLDQKIDHAIGAVESFRNKTQRPVYISFSGGKDSTVLLHLVRTYIDADIPAVFNNTGNEYPEIIQFVKSTPNVTIIRPAITVPQVLSQHGFPLISKEQAQYIREARTTKSEKLLLKRLHGGAGGIGKISDRWSFLVNEPFETSEKCCHQLKKRPFRRYEKETDQLPILGTMATESRTRQQAYINRGGCNSFSPNNLSCNPLSIWTDSDIWEYIRRFDVPYCKLYDMEGCNRTGCMFCGFGAHIEKESRFKLLYALHPKAYQLFMNYTNNGITYKEALQKIGVELPD